MKRPNITPGPWTQAQQICGEGLWIESAADEPEEVCMVSAATGEAAEVQANARAIAALPDIMQALEKCHAFMLELQKGGYCIDCDHEKDTAQEALTKAGYTF